MKDKDFNLLLKSIAQMREIRRRRKQKKLFTQFLDSIKEDANSNPDKLKDAKEVWDAEWDKLLKDVKDN